MKSIRFQRRHTVTVHDHGAFDIAVAECGLYRCFPALDGEPVRPRSVTVSGRGEQLTVTYRLAELDLTLRFTGEKDRLVLRSRLSGLRGVREIASVDLFRAAALVGHQKVLAHGYFSWDQSTLVAAADIDCVESHGLTAVLGESQALILGFLQHDRMMQSFTIQASGNQSTIDCTACLEGKDLQGVESVDLSDLVLFTHASLDRGQRRWAQQVARANGVRLTKPPLRGWCSWYYDYFWFSGETLDRHLRTFAPYKEALQLDVFVIDANWFRHLGDWLETNERFPEGLEAYARRIAAAGYVPGLWIGPWMVGDRSRLFREHPDWLCRDEAGELIEFMSPLGEDSVWGFRDKIHYCLDTSHPEAFAYLRRCFRTLREWGFRYFKTDFMYWGALDRFEGGWYHEGVNAHNFIADRAQRPRIRRARPGRTRVEYFLDVLRMIREEVGPDSTLLGCGQPIWMSIGYVDCMRISRDVGARWVAHNSPQQLLHDLSLRNFTNGVFYQVDPDCVLLRHFEQKLTDDEITALGLYMGVSQGMIMTSDPVDRCKKARRDFFAFIQGDGKVAYRQPLLGREEDLILYVGKRRDSGLGVLFAFNPTDIPQERTFACKALGLPEHAYVCAWRREKKVTRLAGDVTLKLAPHQATLLYVSEKRFKPGWTPTRISG